jgi:hypothetical protein
MKLNNILKICMLVWTHLMFSNLGNKPSLHKYALDCPCKVLLLARMLRKYYAAMQHARHIILRACGQAFVRTGHVRFVLHRLPTLSERCKHPLGR